MNIYDFILVIHGIFRMFIRKIIPTHATMGLVSIKDTRLKMSYVIASPSMQDPYFGNSVVCLCSYDTKGAFGFVLNKPIPLTIAELLQQLPEVKEWYEEQVTDILEGDT